MAKFDLIEKEFWNKLGSLPVSYTWHQQCNELVKFERANGHCMGPFKYEKVKYLGHCILRDDHTQGTQGGTREFLM
jgi:hypothetical protein